MADREPRVRRANIIDLVDERDALPAFRRRRRPREEPVLNAGAAIMPSAGADRPGDAGVAARTTRPGKWRAPNTALWAAGGMALTAVVLGSLSVSVPDLALPAPRHSSAGQDRHAALPVEAPGLLMPEPLHLAVPAAEAPSLVAAPLQQLVLAPQAQADRMEIERLSPVRHAGIVQAAVSPVEDRPLGAGAGDRSGADLAAAAARSGSSVPKVRVAGSALVRARNLANCRAVIIRVQLGETLTGAERRRLQNGCS